MKRLAHMMVPEFQLVIGYKREKKETGLVGNKIKIWWITQKVTGKATQDLADEVLILRALKVYCL